MVWLESVVFSREAAVLAAQIAPILVVAFIVEVRALGERRRIHGRDSKSLLWFVFGSFGVLIVTCFVCISGPQQLRGLSALTAWSIVGSSLALLTGYVAMAAWASMKVTSDDGAHDKARAEQLDRHLSEPGWKWLLRGHR